MKINTQKMRDKIKYLVDKDPTLANDDLRLIANVWYLEGWTDLDLYKNLKNVSHPETIRRTRAKLTEEGIIIPDHKITQARKNEENYIKNCLR